MSSDSIITIQELLKVKVRNKGFQNAKQNEIKLFRHSESCKVESDSCIYNDGFQKKPAYDLYWENYDKFLEWQCEQEDEIMKGVKYIVVFIGEEHCEARFIGVFENHGVHKDSPRNMKNNKGKQYSRYDLQKIDGFDILINQVVIYWGTSQRWVQNWATDKDVVRIEQKTSKDIIPLFKRYEDVILTYDQLNLVVKDKDWRHRLECLNCVYLITDKNNGKKYVGVTYKDRKPGMKSGILSRWTEYATNGHGDNKKLKELINKKGITYAEQYFQWSILETLPLNVPAKVAIERESLHKEKLDTRGEHGYNEN